MKYYHLMTLLGGFILYMLLNIYPIIVYLIGIIKERDFKEILNMPLTIIGLLIPMIGSLYGLVIVDCEKKMVSNSIIHRNVSNAIWNDNLFSSIF